jgi:PTH1 family peptidyl-tRNA hydrolase
VRLIVGLGNPGEPYTVTRHNVGVMVLEQAAATWGIPLRLVGMSRRGEGRIGQAAVVLAQPLTWMNLSGAVVRDLLGLYGLSPSDLVVVHDDLDLAFGRLRLKHAGGSGGHNGVRSLLTALQTGNFIRLKIGVGRPAPGQSAADHVLAPFSPEEASVLQGALDRAVQALECLAVEGPAAAMNRFNVRSREPH